MVAISREIAAYIHSRRPDIPISSTCKFKPKGKRKKRSIEETPEVLQLLKEYNEKYVKVIFDSEKQ